MASRVLRCLLGLASMVGVAGAAGVATASPTLTSASYELVGGSFHAGGDAGLSSTAGSPTIGASGATVGETAAGPTLTGTGGTTLEPGFWPILLPEPSGPWSTGAILLAAAALGRSPRRQR